MASARGAACGWEGRWEARRGASLSGLACPSCGGPLSGPVAAAGRAVGHRCPRLACRLCGRRGWACAGGVGVVAHRVHVDTPIAGRVALPPGSPVCLAHRGVDEVAPGVEACRLGARAWLWSNCYVCGAALPGLAARVVVGRPAALASGRGGLSDAVWVPAGAVLCGRHGAPVGPCGLLPETPTSEVLHVF